jgi:thiamine biosynthesis lipoprotein
MGTTVRLVVVAGDDAAGRAAAAEAVLRDYDERLSRFRPDSELCALNADPRRRVRCSPLLRGAVAAALWAAERTCGLVDPTLLDALEAAGYATSFVPGDAPPLTDRPPVVASPHPAPAWRAIRVHGPTGTITRPPGLRLDLGGTGKGHAADLAASVLEGAPSWVVDCGGDIRVGGGAGAAHAIDVEGPRGGAPLDTLHLRTGAVATSSIHARAWRRPDGSRAHHLLDPATGRPVHTPITAATALAPTALEAETLAKAAVLTGDARWLDPWGGITIDRDGTPRRHRGTVP